MKLLNSATISVKAVFRLAFMSLNCIFINLSHFGCRTVFFLFLIFQTLWLTLMEVFGVVEVLLKCAEAGCNEARKESANNCNGKCGKEG